MPSGCSRWRLAPFRRRDYAGLPSHLMYRYGREPMQESEEIARISGEVSTQKDMLTFRGNSFAPLLTCARRDKS
jgi:hypothetical protein